MFFTATKHAGSVMNGVGILFHNRKYTLTRRKKILSNIFCFSNISPYFTLIRYASIFGKTNFFRRIKYNNVTNIPEVDEKKKPFV